MADSALFISGALFTTDYLVEAIAATAAYRAVNVAGLRARFDQIAAAFPQNQRTNESQTEDDFIWPVLAALGWSASLRQQNLTVTGRDDVPDGLLFADAAAKASANAQGDQWRRYEHGLAVVESKRWARPLDRASGRDEATAPSTQMLRYLRRIDDLTRGSLRWGILTNGTRWRLYWAGARSISEEFLEIDLGRVLALGDDGPSADSASRDHWLRVFAVMFGREAFLQDGAGQRSFHDRARAEAAFYEERVAASLSKLVFDIVFPSLATAIANNAPDAPLGDVRDAALVLLYRLLFLLYAEDRDLLPVNDTRYDDYALRPLRLDVGRRITSGDAFSSSAARIWSHVADLSRIIDQGDGSVGIPPYNGGLFATAGAPLLSAARVPDSVMALALDALSYERSSGERRYINYRDLSVQQLGSIYERLLEFELIRDESGVLSVRPNLFARKNSGSYYTPDELVGLILDETLEPLITERLDAFRKAIGKLNPKDAEDYQRRELRDADPANAILSLRVCDPAMGSGHFLVSLVDTLADHVLEAMAEGAVLGADLHYTSPLADKIEEIRTTIQRNAREANWTIDPEQLDDRHIVRRMVLKRCVYGVDKNPMAVELAKVALWLHTFTVGAPLSFIDHHLRSGDSLFGLWVRDAIDKAGAGGELFYIDALRNAQRSAEAMKTIEALTDVEIAEAHRSAAMYDDVELMTGELDGFVSLIHALDWLDLKAKDDKALVRLWLDGSFGDPISIARGRLAPAIHKVKPAEAERFNEILTQARALIAEERFLNWQISFPGVWSNWASLGREGGFDAVVGNPNTGTAPIFRSRRDMALTTAIYARLPVLVDRSGTAPVATWPVRYFRMFDMTNDSHLFRTRAELEEREGAWSIGGNRFQSAAGEWVPLYVGRMIHQFDHRAASVVVNEANLHNPALSGDVTSEMKADPSFLPASQYWLLATDSVLGTAIGFRDIARSTDARTMIAAMIPHRAAGNTAPLILSDAPPAEQALLLGNLNALVLDYVARQKAQSTHLNWYIVEQLPITPPAAYSRTFGPKTAAEIVREAVLELTYTANDLAPFAREIGHVDAAGDVLPPFIWDNGRRLRLRAKLDALYFILYGVFDPADPAQSRDDIRYIYSTFPIVEREESAKWGSYRSRDLCLAWINALIAGQPDAEVAG